MTTGKGRLKITTQWLLLGCMMLGACSQADKSAPTSVAPLLTQSELQTQLDAVQLAHAHIPGFSLAVVLPDGTLISASTGTAAPDGQAMSADTPVRLASISKTFVAAAVLRLEEQDQVQLDDTIDRYVGEHILALLTADGYRADQITLRHLLLHTAGLNDHFPSEAYQQRVLSDPTHEWTAVEQLEMFVDTTQKLSEPGTTYSYSDPGYILLGLLLERVTGNTMGQAVRELLALDRHGLETTWWEGETPADNTPTRAHQWLGDQDTWSVHGSVDAFGGGGLIASVTDTAEFFHALFADHIFAKPETRKSMQTGLGHPKDSDYRYGLFTNEVAGYTVFGHGGFWGTDAVAVPDLQLAMAGVALEQSGIRALRKLEGELIELMVSRLPNQMTQTSQP